MPAHPPEVDVPDDVFFWRFKNQTRLGHALVALGGVAVWIAVYTYWLDATWGTPQLMIVETGEAAAARRDAMRMATTACMAWFSLTFMVGKGGPFLNTVTYPIVLIVTGPWAAALVVYGTTPGSISGGSPISARFVVDGFAMFLPGALLTIALVGGFLLVIYFVTGTGPAWEEKHMPDAWHDLELENPEKWE
ncbi:hypothetical protein [Halomicrobium urmianum]|uniref:hypothetical protein n=1 Tax=Halomicrobium urmianum TaxID=1586233 RepID=UPI001CD9A8CB|nr:hypothetical protein [Halomicrobium urmianum]